MGFIAYSMMEEMPTMLSPESPSVADARASGPVPVMRTAILLFLFLNFLYLLVSPGRARSIDEIDPVFQSESLLLRHTTAIPQAVKLGIYFGKRDLHGTARSAWPFGHAVLVLPWAAVGNYLLERIPGITGQNDDLAHMAGTCWSNATYAALAVAASFLLFLKLGNSRRSALKSSLLLGLSTPLFLYSGWLFSEPVTTALFVIAALVLFGSGKEVSLSRAVVGALVLGFSIHVRPANLVTVLIFIAVALLLEQSQDGTIKYRTALTLMIIVGISGALYLARNYVFFGNPFDFGVPTVVENGKNPDTWHNPFWRGAFGFLFSPGKSAFLFCPPTILGILGLPRLWRRNRALTVLAAAATPVNLVMYSFRTQWDGGYCIGPRYLVPGLVLLCLPIAALFQEPRGWFRPAFWITAIVGFLVQAISLSTNVLEDMVRNHYYVGNFEYRMSYSPLSGQLRLIWKYLHASPTVVGGGWDRWFLMLHAGGADSSVLAVIACLMLAGTLIFGILLRASVRDAS
jgi:hypothetical protein